MSLLLAIEPDPQQARTLRQTIEEHVESELILADSKDAAIEAICQRVPDLILVSALLSPTDEDDLIAHLRTLEAPHLQTLTVPLLAPFSKDQHRQKRGLLQALKPRRRSRTQPAGCDPEKFAKEIVGYLERARSVKAERTPTETVPSPWAGEVFAVGAPTEQPVGEPPAPPAEAEAATPVTDQPLATPTSRQSATLADEVFEWADSCLTEADAEQPVVAADTDLLADADVSTPETSAPDLVELVEQDASPGDPGDIADDVSKPEPMPALSQVEEVRASSDDHQSAPEVEEPALVAATDVLAELDVIPLEISVPDPVELVEEVRTSSDDHQSAPEAEELALTVVSDAFPSREVGADGTEEAGSTQQSSSGDVLVEGPWGPLDDQLLQGMVEVVEVIPSTAEADPTADPRYVDEEASPDTNIWLMETISKLQLDLGRFRKQAVPPTPPPSIPEFPESGERQLSERLPSSRPDAPPASVRPAEQRTDSPVSRLATSPRMPVVTHSRVLMPLATWARRTPDERIVLPRTDSMEGRSDGVDDLRDLIHGLAVPPHIACVEYPRGCRIQRVRVSPGKQKRRRKDSSDPIIVLSKRALSETRSGSSSA